MSINICSLTVGTSEHGSCKVSGGDYTKNARYKAAERDFGKDIDMEIAKMSKQQRMIFEMLGGKEGQLRRISQSYDANGDFVGIGGVAGMYVGDGKNGLSSHQMIKVSKESRQKMFDMVKKEFIRENGVANGNTTRRSEVFREYQLSINKENRLKGTWSLEQYEQQYRAALASAVRASNPNWKNGQPFDASILDNITRETVESTLVQKGNTLIRKSVDYSI